MSADDAKAKALRLISLGCRASAGHDLSPDERDEIYEALMELAIIVDPPESPRMPNNPDDFYAAMDYIAGTEAAKVIAARWGYASDDAFRKVVERNRPACDAIFANKGVDWCRREVSEYQSVLGRLSALELDPQLHLRARKSRLLALLAINIL